MGVKIFFKIKRSKSSNREAVDKIQDILMLDVFWFWLKSWMRSMQWKEKWKWKKITKLSTYFLKIESGANKTQQKTKQKNC